MHRLIAVLRWVFPRRRRSRGLLDVCRVTVGAIVVFTLLGRPIRVGSVRWWKTPAIAASIGLTPDQMQAIDHLYQEHLPARRHCIERFVQASNRVDQLLRDAIYDRVTLRQTQEVMNAVAEERAAAAELHGQLAGILSPAQRLRLEQLRRARVIE